MGHNHVADYWSYACLLYELVVGQTPFFEAGIDQLSMLKKIVKAKYKFPADISIPNGSNGLDKALYHWTDLISRLLKPKHVERLGNLQHGCCDILDHDCFAHIVFNEFRKQTSPAPWVPTITNPLDTSHFGNNFQREEREVEVFPRKISAKDQETFDSF